MRALIAQGVGRRLLASYVGAFAIVIVVFALAVRFSFAAILDAEVTSRLNTLARAGTAAVQFVGNGYEVNDASFGGFSLHADSEGLEWFDRNGRLRAHRGQGVGAAQPPREGAQRFSDPSGVLVTYTVTLRDSHDRDLGLVRAIEVYNPSSDPVHALDRGLIAGAIIALLAGALGGTLLARSSVARIEEGYQRLREFTADASHELRGPLAALSGTASVALREAPDLPAATRSRLEAIAKLSQQMRRLIDDLLILARAERSMERELFVVTIDDLIANVQARYGEFGANGPAGLEVYGNPDQIERIVANLVENALRHAGPGGHVDVAWSADQHRLHLTVSDTGGGIAPEHLARVFDRFWRADNARRADGGSGLGLAIARALARRHGGDLTVTSELGRGSMFAVSIPLRPPSLG